jgi:hypothetical protein
LKQLGSVDQIKYRTPKSIYVLISVLIVAVIGLILDKIFRC